MNKETLNKLLKSSNWDDNLLAFEMLRFTKYSELEDLLDTKLDKRTGYIVYQRKCDNGRMFRDTMISKDIVVYSGTGAILFIPKSWYNGKSIKLGKL